jgi:hypothetical protein
MSRLLLTNVTIIAFSLPFLNASMLNNYLYFLPSFPVRKLAVKYFLTAAAAYAMMIAPTAADSAICVGFPAGARRTSHERCG